MIVCSAFTSGASGGGYERFVDQWLASVRQHMPEASLYVRNLGAISTWREAAHRKPAIIEAAWCSGEPVLWIDIDATVLRAPTPILELDPRTTGFAFRQVGKHSTTGTLFVGHAEGIEDALSAWVERSRDTTLPRNQLHFEHIVRTHQPKVTPLPPGCTILGHRKESFPEHESFILHHQEFKNQRGTERGA